MAEVPDVLDMPARADDLNFRRVVHIFLRTWPFMRPARQASSPIFVAVSVPPSRSSAAVLGVHHHRPDERRHRRRHGRWANSTSSIYGLDPAVYVNVEALSADARLSLCWPVIISAPSRFWSLAVAGGATGILFYYGIWIFQGINQRMRVTLIDRLQAQSLAFHASARTGRRHLPGLPGQRHGDIHHPSDLPRTADVPRTPVVRRCGGRGVRPAGWR